MRVAGGSDGAPHRRDTMPNRKQGDEMELLGWVVLGFLVFLALSTILGSFFTVNTAQVAVITRFGKFLRVANAGLNWKWPFIDAVAGRVSLRVNQITLTMETKTKDNVFVTIPISVQNRVRPENVFDAYYKLANPVEQIQSYVEQVILGHVPGMTLDEVFASQSGIAAAVKQELDADMAAFGYEIVNVLVTDIVPDAKVKSAMNDINAAQREQVAANARGEAEKILVVKKAEAEAESKALQGQGIANQRKAIIEGLRSSIEQFQKVVGDASVSEVMQLVMVTQYFDTIKSIGESDKTNTLFLSHSPGAVRDISDQILQSMLVAEKARP
ncbi:MAG TPA: SPFH domain-containing protein [Xanthobacteraceae bacterium]|nr:SPFH domain-containing protein [Xanthobacteraceae bacterium]